MQVKDPPVLNSIYVDCVQKFKSAASLLRPDVPSFILTLNHAVFVLMILIFFIKLIPIKMDENRLLPPLGWGQWPKFS